MKKIGIDFGTTNSTIAYRNEQGNISGYRFGGGGGKEYIPSAIAYPKDSRDSEEVRIGEAAQTVHRTDPDDYYYYEFYKLALCNSYTRILNAEHGKRVIDVVKDYLHLLIVRYKWEQFVAETDRSAKLEHIVLALPNVISDDLIADAEAVKDELQDFLDTEAEESQFRGEASCACEFYVSRPKNQGFTGTIIVVDYGGGTLDISNCRITRSGSEANIAIVVQKGTSVDDRNTFGFAGVAFDQGVVRSIPEIAMRNLSKPELAEYAVAFERYKIENHDEIRNRLNKYYSEGGDIKPLNCELKGQRYTLDIPFLHDIFEQVNQPLLKKYFDEVVPEDERRNGAAAEQDTFRVLLIGGFSQLPCVEKAVKDFLNIDLAELYDKRIAHVNVNEKFIAVAHGAAIYGEKAGDAPEICLFEIGVKAFDGQETYNDVMVRENTELKALREVQWSAPYYIVDPAKGNVTVYCRTSAGGEQTVRLDIAEVCTASCRVRLGVITRGRRYTLHIQNIDTNTECMRDISALIADYRNRN
ncbi:MAG: Hsp70 family protein [Treponema sp.]|jgi:hypothetical protein|nr:Hsp70 family protein [Treponema sp.]